MLTLYPKMGQHTVLKKEGFVSLRQGGIYSLKFFSLARSKTNLSILVLSKFKLNFNFEFNFLRLFFEIKERFLQG